MAQNNTDKDNIIPIDRIEDEEILNEVNPEKFSENEQVSLETPPGGTISKTQKK